jgi:hypothetical protein
MIKETVTMIKKSKMGHYTKHLEIHTVKPVFRGHISNKVAL